MKREWIALRVTVPADVADAVSNFCHERASEGVLLEEVPGGETVVTAYFSADRWRAVQPEWRTYAAELEEIFPDLEELHYTIVPVKNENWAILWRDRFEPLDIGKTLMVTPPWITPESRGRKVIMIEPAEAFGTGNHETTQGCLVLLEEAIEQLKQDQDRFSLVDVGCGSGILAIAGVILGADPVLGVDNDPAAVASAGRNARLNEVEHRLQLKCVSLAELTGSWDLVTANLDPLTLTDRSGQLISLADRFLIISGVPVDQWGQVRAVFLETGLRLEKELTVSEWGAGLFSR
jgi:ribosomal protein L11 methyltransferase